MNENDRKIRLRKATTGLRSTCVQSPKNDRHSQPSLLQDVKIHVSTGFQVLSWHTMEITKKSTFFTDLFHNALFEGKYGRCLLS